MITDIGHFALVLTLGVALLQASLPMAGSFTGNRAWMALARPAGQTQFVLVAIAFAALAYAFLTDNFGLVYVAQNSNTQMPWIYKFSAVWGAHEGSLLLWLFILSVWTLAITLFSRGLPEEYIARVLSVMGMISIGFTCFLLFTSNPFQEIFPAPLQGRELNPLLQDPGLAIHPPMLYTGYVGFSVAFAFALAALISGRLDATWARWSRPWTTVAWMFLTIGIGLGSWWAYNELGWGGWWFWDPVENASFMPWLVGTALIHSLAVTEKRDTFKAWTVLLAIIAFSLSLLGTFLVRSGVLTSVHAFATDPERGLFILIFLGVVIGGSLSLYAWRGGQIRSIGHFELFSRESLMLMNNVLLVVTAFFILLGTLYPLILDALTGEKISVGPPYFNLVFMLLMTPLVLLIVLGPLVRWKGQNLWETVKTLRVPLGVSTAGFVLALLLLPPSKHGRLAMTAMGIMLGIWVFSGLIVSVREKFRHRKLSLESLKALPVSYYGMLLGHFGIAVFVTGVTVLNTYQTDDDMRVTPGQQVQIGGYNFRFEGVAQQRGPNYMAQRGTISVSQGDKYITTLYPEKRVYMVQTMPMTEAAIDDSLLRDLYISLGEPVGSAGDGAWLMRIYYKPFQRWIWLAPLLMAIGGFLAASDRRYRQRQKQVLQDTVVAQQLLDELLATSAAKG
ncbi:MAG: heme lyase CcmF/NrfE family subunit [Gammaproteobacteria bacterium]|nr:heme lyase CcmF/NrfE family subunit [Gammaproteobacteria bacterium]